MPQIVTIGEILVEIMATKIDQTFLEPGLWEAPFPSGAPASFTAQAARTGCTAGIVSCVGDDDFGRLNLRRLETHGVDTSHIRVTGERTTGCAFVTYRNDGSRSFIFHISNAACGLIDPEQIDAPWLADCEVLHVMGTSLSLPGVAESTFRAAEIVRARGGKISFDPNIRPELLGEAMRKQLFEVLAMTDIFLPGISELPLFADGCEDVQQAVDHLFAAYPGMKIIVVKKGAEGCMYADRSTRFAQAALPTVEVDPTGAGDCFAGALIGSLVQGLPAEQAVRLAQAAGASAVSIKGPMEGVATLEALHARLDACNR